MSALVFVLVVWAVAMVALIVAFKREDRRLAADVVLPPEPLTFSTMQTNCDVCRQGFVMPYLEPMTRSHLRRFAECFATHHVCAVTR